MIRLSRLKVSRFVDLFNLFNSNAEQNTSYNSGTSFLRPLNIIPPRIARIAARGLLSVSALQIRALNHKGHEGHKEQRQALCGLCVLCGSKINSATRSKEQTCAYGVC